jgi:hypothetical protein
MKDTLPRLLHIPHIPFIPHPRLSSPHLPVKASCLPLGSGGERGVVVFRMVVVAGRLASTSIFPSCHQMPESSVACPERSGSVAIRLISENSLQLAHDWLLRPLGHVNLARLHARLQPACRTARMARLQDGTTAALHARLQACQYSFWPTLHCILPACAYAWKLWAETLLSPQSGKVPRHVEAELPLPAHPINQIAGWVLGICRFAIAVM